MTIHHSRPMDAAAPGTGTGHARLSTRQPDASGVPFTSRKRGGSYSVGRRRRRSVERLRCGQNMSLIQPEKFLKASRRNAEKQSRGACVHKESGPALNPTEACQPGVVDGERVVPTDRAGRSKTRSTDGRAALMKRRASANRQRGKISHRSHRAQPLINTRACRRWPGPLA